ncbi:rhomboid family intramembrane serine protease [Haloferula sargassicola]|uniref:Rhomboid family intramembrane serine protease n=1 Tax=Haloferula sargassicola TaxID=490096 RepID=A0ABP9UVN6_9BACT
MGFADRDYQARQVTRPALPPVTKALLIANVVVFLLDFVFRSERGLLVDGIAMTGPFEQYGAFNVSQAFLHGQLWRLVTFQFLHFSLGHIFFNMIGVYVFAPWVERWWGSKSFAAYYLLCGAAGAVFFSLLMSIGLLPNANSVQSNLVGASAGVFGLLFAVYRIAPGARVALLIPPVTLTMRQLALVFAGLAMLTILGGLIFPNASWFANSGGEAGHLGGALMGLLLMRFPGVLGKGTAVREKVIRPRQFRHRRAGKIRPRTEVDLHSESEVDRILEKVSSEGIGSLTEEERAILQEASQRPR